MAVGLNYSEGSGKTYGPAPSAAQLTEHVNTYHGAGDAEE